MAETNDNIRLGSTRAVTKTDGTILEQNDYYPFGLRTTRGENYSTLSESLAAIAQNANNTTANTVVPEYLYNGKEKQNFMKNTSAVINAGGATDYTSNYMDYGARFYNPTTIRWNTQDPMAEKYQRYSPYNYCVNNPISLVDPNGQNCDIIIENGKVVIRATYYTTEENKNYLEKAFALLTQQNETYQYVVDKETYDIVFDLKYEVVSQERLEELISSPKRSGEIMKNTFSIGGLSYSSDNDGESKNVARKGVRDIFMNGIENALDERKVAHEIIHTLGRKDHSDFGGLMAINVGDSRSSNLEPDDYGVMLRPLLEGINGSNVIMNGIIYNIDGNGPAKKRDIVKKKNKK